MKPIISEPGAYPDIAAEDYHRNANLLPGPSLSSSGAKKILNSSPYHFWFDSPLNPAQPPERDKPHLNIGKAAHDVILLTERWPEFYHVTPEGFSRAKSKAMADEIAEADEAVKAGKTVLSFDEAETVNAVAAAIKNNALAMSALSNGVCEETLAYRDPLTSVWLRARPDFRPHSIGTGKAVRVVADLKFMAATFCSPAGFSRAITNFGYHQSAAFYWDALKAIFGEPPTNWLHIVVEKPEQGVKACHAPISVSLYELPIEDIDRGRVLNRTSIRIFDECLQSGKWPAYADAPAPVGLSSWARKQIDEVEN